MYLQKTSFTVIFSTLFIALICVLFHRSLRKTLIGEVGVFFVWFSHNEWLSGTENVIKAKEKDIILDVYHQPFSDIEEIVKQVKNYFSESISKRTKTNQKSSSFFIVISGYIQSRGLMPKAVLPIPSTHRYFNS